MWLRRRSASLPSTAMKVRDLINAPPPLHDHRALLYHRHQQANSMLRPSATSSRAPSPSSASAQRPSRRATIVLIGMPGVGKSTLASITAMALGWEMLDTDAIFESRQQMSIPDYIATRGRDAMQLVESDILADILHNNPTEKVVACGAGVIELEQNRALLRQFRDYGVVIHVLRDKDAVAAYTRSSLVHQHDPDTWDKRVALYRDCCSYEFPSLTSHPPPDQDVSMDGSKHELSVIFKPVEQDFFRLLRFIHGVDTNKVPTRPHRTYFLSLTFDDINKALPHLEDLSVGTDLWAIRVDLLASYDFSYLSFQIATLRRHSPLPISFALRMKFEAGHYPNLEPDNPQMLESFTAYFQHALRLGVEYMEVATHYPPAVVKSIVTNKVNTSIIGLYCDTGNHLRWDSLEARRLYDNIVAMGADVAVIALPGRSFEDNMKLRVFAASVENGPIPFIGLNMGNEGKISRALNHYLSPVSHPLVPIPPPAGHVTFQECQSILYLTGLLPPKKYYVFGHPIPHSMSPILYNAAFTALGLPHTYSKLDTPNMDEIRKVMEQPDFGGASVTLPHARNIIPLVQHLSRHAQIIGAVNTIQSAEWGGPGLIGDNTDWKGIKNCLCRALTPAHAVTSSTTALVLGAGGSARATIYALYRTGVVNIFVYNRSGSKARILVDDFQRLDHLLRVTVLDCLDDLPIVPPPCIIVSTVPAIAGPMDTTAKPVDLGLKLEHLSMNGGVVVELAYEKKVTPLLALAEQRRQQGSPWESVDGIEVLLEQAFEQIRFWTGRSAPRKQVRRQVIEAYQEMCL